MPLMWVWVVLLFFFFTSSLLISSFFLFFRFLILYGCLSLSLFGFYVCFVSSTLDFFFWSWAACLETWNPCGKGVEEVVCVISWCFPIIWKIILRSLMGFFYVLLGSSFLVFDGVLDFFFLSSDGFVSIE